MKRSPIVLLGTVAGVAGVLMMNPSGDTLVATAATEAGTGGTTGSATSSIATTNTTSTATQSAAVSGTATGDAVYVRYGYVQVSVTVDNGKITDITSVQLPDQDGRSRMISQQAEPLLQAQALKAQSANINGISGATYTTHGYKQSLQSALDQLGF